MKAAATLVSLAAMAGVALSQGVTSAIAPTASSPAGCSASYDGTFEITVAEVTIQKRSEPIAKRSACASSGTLVASLKNGILTDAQGRTGYIASNYQFQFDHPPQAGALYTSGFSVCTNGSLALGGSEVFYECLSGDFYNLYDRTWAAQCSPVEIIVLPCGGDTSESNDGQVVGTQIVTTTVVSLLSDGQPQVKTTTTGVPLCQISQIGDGQVQVATTPCASITTTVNTATSTLAPVSQYSDGQIQVTPAASVPTVTAPSATATGSVASGSLVTVPTNSVPVTGGGSSVSSAGSSATSSSPSTGTSAPASSGAAAGSMKMGSMAALMVGLIGAVAFF